MSIFKKTEKKASARNLGGNPDTGFSRKMGGELSEHLVDHAMKHRRENAVGTTYNDFARVAKEARQRTAPYEKVADTTRICTAGDFAEMVKHYALQVPHDRAAQFMRKASEARFKRTASIPVTMGEVRAWEKSASMLVAQSPAVQGMVTEGLAQIASLPEQRNHLDRQARKVATQTDFDRVVAELGIGSGSVDHRFARAYLAQRVANRTEKTAQLAHGWYEDQGGFTRVYNDEIEGHVTLNVENKWGWMLMAPNSAVINTGEADSMEAAQAACDEAAGPTTAKLAQAHPEGKLLGTVHKGDQFWYTQDEQGRKFELKELDDAGVYLTKEPVYFHINENDEACDLEVATDHTAKQAQSIQWEESDRTPVGRPQSWKATINGEELVIELSKLDAGVDQYTCFMGGVPFHDAPSLEEAQSACDTAAHTAKQAQSNDAFLDALCDEFPGFLTDSEVNAADLVGWVANSVDAPWAQGSALVDEIRQVFPALFKGEEGYAEGADLIDLISNHLENIHRGKQAQGGEEDPIGYGIQCDSFWQPRPDSWKLTDGWQEGVNTAHVYATLMDAEAALAAAPAGEDFVGKENLDIIPIFEGEDEEDNFDHEARVALFERTVDGYHYTAQSKTAHVIVSRVGSGLTYRVEKYAADATPGDKPEHVAEHEGLAAALVAGTEYLGPKEAQAADPVVAQFEKAKAEEALSGDADGTEQNKAFDMAQAAGYDWESDQEFLDYALKATPAEVLAKGLELYLKHAGKTAKSYGDVVGIEPAAKDIDRMESMKEKSDGDEQKVLQYAFNMARVIMDSDKALRRGKAAETVFGGTLGDQVAKIFEDRAKEIDGD